MGGGVAGGWVAGMPFPTIILPVVAGSALGCFFDTPNLLIWLVFVGSALGTGAWFLWSVSPFLANLPSELQPYSPPLFLDIHKRQNSLPDLGVDTNFIDNTPQGFSML